MGDSDFNIPKLKYTQIPYLFLVTKELQIQFSFYDNMFCTRNIKPPPIDKTSEFITYRVDLLFRNDRQNKGGKFSLQEIANNYFSNFKLIKSSFSHRLHNYSMKEQIDG